MDHSRPEILPQLILPAKSPPHQRPDPDHPGLATNRPPAVGRYDRTEGNAFEPLSQEAQAAIQQHVDQFHGMFIKDVAAGRGVSESTVQQQFGQGRMMLAQDALQAGMVDRVETYSQAHKRLTAAKLSATEARLEATLKQLDRLLSGSDSEAGGP